ncbi:MAG TPA: hypothetical protein VK666_29800 [Chryseolinea sp.]|nr:hypothetical protein [Chryseolinea sp.]
MAAIIAALSTVANAQDSLKYSTISLGVGFNSIENKDAFQSPYTYRGANMMFNATYSNVRVKGHHIIDVNYTAGHIKSIVSPQARNELLLLNYDYLFKLKSRKGDGKFVPSLGLGLHTLISKTNYLPTIERPTSYLSAAVVMTFSGDMQYRFGNKNSLRLQFAIPVVGLTYRPDFEINGKSSTAAASVSIANVFTFKLEYEYKLAPKLGLFAGYYYHYTMIDEPSQLVISQNIFLVGVRKKF